MFICSLHISRRTLWKIAVAAAAVLLLLGIACVRQHEIPAEPSAELHSNRQRILYLQNLGWRVQPVPVETLHLLLPKPLTEPYLSYNQLQKKQGFDLEKYDGKRITRYTYAVKNYPHRADGVQINLYLYKNIPMAGDVIATGENGFRSGLSYPGSTSRPK